MHTLVVQLRQLVVLPIALNVLLASVCLAQPVSSGVDAEWEKAQHEFKSPPSLSTQEDCEKVWTFMWGWAKRGAAGARGQLGGSIGFALLIPPGLTQDLPTKLRHSWT